MYPIDGDFNWRWAFYGLFGVKATHAIETLEICEDNITLREIRQVRDFMEAPRPLERLRIQDQSTEDPSASPSLSQVVLKLGACVYLSSLSGVTDDSPQLASNEEFLLTTTPRQTFDVIQANETLFKIVVPGYGECQVKREDVIEEIPLPLAIFWRLESHSVRTLVVRKGSHWSRRGKCGVMALLELIGRPLRSLILETSDNKRLAFSAISCNFPACSSSKPDASIQSLDTLLVEYAESTCKLTLLALMNLTIEDIGSIKTFADALANPETAIAKTLEQLELTWHNPRTAMTDANIRAFLDMHETNHRLRYLSLALLADQVACYRAEFERFNGESTTTSRCPLSSSAKLAFLSVVARMEGEAAAHLDSHVVDIIFEVTAVTYKRKVMIIHKPW